MKNENEDFETIVDETKNDKPAEKIETPEVETISDKPAKKDYTDIIILIILVVLTAGVMIYLNYKKKNEDGNSGE